MTAIFKITDGDDSIELIDSIFHVNTWAPGMPQFKNGGIWQDATILDGRTLESINRTNVTEIPAFMISAPCEDDTIAEIRKLLKLLEKAVAYATTPWQNTPVWIEARNVNETNTRYGTIKGYQSNGLPENPYRDPFALSTTSAVEDFICVIEHDIWKGYAPNQEVCLQIDNLTPWPSIATNDFSPTLSDDDAAIDLNTLTINTAAITLNLGRNAIGDNNAVGIRFRTVNIPPGATITSAFMVFYSEAALSGSVRLIVDGEQNIAPAVFSTYDNFVNRTRTAAQVSFSIDDAWALGSTYSLETYTDLKEIVQEIVDLPGWASGNNLVLFIWEADNVNRRLVCSLDGANPAPILRVTWEIGEQDYGYSSSCDETPTANKDNEAQINHAYWWDASAGTWSTNLINPGGGFPIKILPSGGGVTPAVGDRLYLGISTSVPNSGPFGSVFFNISVVGVNLSGMLYRYWNGGAVALPGVIDNTIVGNRYFAKLGKTNVSWPQPGDWTTSALAPAVPVTAYWMYFEVSAVAGATVAPSQQLDNLYTVTRSSINISEANVLGDIPALARAYLRTSGYRNRVLIGARSIFRGDRFRMFLNFSGIQNPIGVRGTMGANVNRINDSYSPVGQSYNYAAGAGGTGDVHIVIDGDTPGHFQGAFKVLVRFWKNTAQNTTTFQFRVKQRGGLGGALTTFESEVIPIMTNLIGVPYQVIDLGNISIPGLQSGRAGDIPNEIDLGIYISNPGAASNFRFYDLILTPIDEWGNDIIAPNSGVFYGGYPATYLDIDSFVPREPSQIHVRDDTTERIMFRFIGLNSAPFVLQDNEDQRLYHATLYSVSDPVAPEGVLWYCFPTINTVQLWSNPQYLLMRGRS